MTTAAQMNTELWQSIGAIADHEILMRRLTRYAKKLAKEQENDSTHRFQEENFDRVDGGCVQIRIGERIRFSNHEIINGYLVRTKHVRRYPCRTQPNMLGKTKKYFDSI